jgi:hypothetical protein
VPALATLTMVWLGAQKPEGRAMAALDAWAESKAVALAEPAEPAAEDASQALALAARCDQALDQARDQLTTGDVPAAQQTLSELEQTLREHPELLQGAWLMAEDYRLEAQAAQQGAAGSSDDAAAWERRADALEGPRATAFGGRSRSTPAPVANVAVTVAVHGARRYEVWWDGVSASDRIATAPGEHHVLIRRGGHTAWSGWISVLVPGTVDVWAPDAPVCSQEDFAGVSSGADGGFVVPTGVRCGAWAVASPGHRGALQVALCSGERCEPPATLVYDTFGRDVAPVAPTKAGWPGWASWTIAGAGLAAVTTIVLWGSGAFNRPEAAKRVGYQPDLGAAASP